MTFKCLLIKSTVYPLTFSATSKRAHFLQPSRIERTWSFPWIQKVAFLCTPQWTRQLFSSIYKKKHPRHHKREKQADAWADWLTGPIWLLFSSALILPPPLFMCYDKFLFTVKNTFWKFALNCRSWNEAVENESAEKPKFGNWRLLAKQSNAQDFFLKKLC